MSKQKLGDLRIAFLRFISRFKFARALLNFFLASLVGLSLANTILKIVGEAPSFWHGFATSLRTVSVASLPWLVVIWLIGPKGLGWKNVAKLSRLSITISLILMSIPISWGYRYASSFCYPVPGRPADVSNKEILVVLAEFEELSDSKLQPDREWQNILEDAKGEFGDNVIFKLLPLTVHSASEAREYSDCLGASMVIWGTLSAAGMDVYFEATPRWGSAVSPEMLEFSGLLEEQVKLLYPGEVALSAVHHLVGQLQLSDGEAEKAVKSLSQALKLSWRSSPKERARIEALLDRATKEAASQ